MAKCMNQKVNYHLDIINGLKSKTNQFIVEYAQFYTFQFFLHLSTLKIDFVQ